MLQAGLYQEQQDGYSLDKLNQEKGEYQGTVLII